MNKSNRKSFWYWVMVVAAVVGLFAAVSWWLKVEVSEWLMILIGTVVGVTATIIDSYRVVRG